MLSGTPRWSFRSSSLPVFGPETALDSHCTYGSFFRSAARTAFEAVSVGLFVRLRRIGGPMATMGFGLLLAFAGFLADFYKHEVQRSTTEIESIWAPVHLPIFIGMGIVSVGFLWALRRTRSPGIEPLPGRPPGRVDSNEPL